MAGTANGTTEWKMGGERKGEKIFCSAVKIYRRHFLMGKINFPNVYVTGG